MATLHKVSVFFCVLFIAVGNVHSSCFNTYNSRKCAYKMTCMNSIDNDELVNFRYPGDVNRDIAQEDTDVYENYNNDENYNDGVIRPINRMHGSCNIIRYQSNSFFGNSFYPVHLKFTTSSESRTTSAIPPFGMFEIVTYLDLSSNSYTDTPKLPNMVNLAQLNLSRNSLTVAELSNTVELPLITEIDLSHNTIRDILYQSPHVYKTLKKIDLSYNSLTQISQKMFDPFNELKTLDISHNFIEVLSQITFEGMGELINLNISYNSISDINSSLFRFTKLKLLDLSNNNIRAIKVSDFDKIISLEVLNLRSNLISVIDKDSFHNMLFMKSLDFSNNKIATIDKDVFNNATFLTTINLSKNVLEKLPKNLFKGTQIRDFSIEDNRLSGSLEKGMFEGLAFVNKLDLGNQNFNSLEDYAFYGLNQLSVLLLNNNNISVITAQSFLTLNTLTRLDLSFNKIKSIEFDKSSLYHLFSFSLRNNLLTEVKKEDFHGLNSLQFLDLSDNKIAQLETNSFESLKELINFEISNNPLSGRLQEKTFDGLSSLPSLDISCTLLSTIQNGSFINMTQLKNLNASHSKINTLGYNTFIHTGVIETIDFSFNELKEFNINSTELPKLHTLYLNNNLLKTLNSFTFQNVISLTKLSLSYNMILNINADIFTNLSYLRILDVSYNTNLNVTRVFLNNSKTIVTLDLSGIKINLSFGNIKDLKLDDLTISNSSVLDVKYLQLNELHRLNNLVLSHNKIANINVGSFNNISNLRYLDLSHNKISYIQPGIFTDNTMLVSLILSHNFLSTLSYGIFRGLIYLRTLDISYNYINDLQNERFYEVKSLNVLIADHNKIESITADEFVGTSLTQLSIGGNPLPCDVLVNLKRSGVSFEITASKLYENNDENVNGVTCNRKLYSFDRITNSSDPNAAENVKVLLSIRDIMLEYFKNYENSKPSTTIDDKYLTNVTNLIQTSNEDIMKNISSFVNSTASIVALNGETNNLLNKILRMLTLNSGTRAPPVQVTKDNATFDNLLSYINKVKQELDDTWRLDKENILNEVDVKISALHLEKKNILNEINAKLLAVNSPANENNLHVTEPPRHEKLSSTADSKSLFTETCVALILVILVCFILFKVYKSGIFVRRSFSVSTRELPGSMDSPL